MCIIKIRLNPIISECFGMSRNHRETRQNIENNQNNSSTNEMSSNNNADSLLHDFGAPPPYRMNNQDQPEINQSIVPKVNSKVICHWQDWQFFKATVVDFHRGNLMYTVDWRDYDQSFRVQPFNLVALDKIPGFDKIKAFLDRSSLFRELGTALIIFLKRKKIYFPKPNDFH